MAYETFFRNNKTNTNLDASKIVEISEFGNTVYNLSINYPIVYGISSILVALIAGVTVSFIRRKVSRWRSQRADQPAKY